MPAKVTRSGDAKERLVNLAKSHYLKYFLASAAALVVDYGCYWALSAQQIMSLPAAAVVGYTLGLALAYVLISGKIFVDGWLRHKKQYEILLFGLSGLFGIALTYTTVFVFVSIFGEHIHGAKLAAVGISFIGVYFFRRCVVFRAKRENA